MGQSPKNTGPRWPPGRPYQTGKDIASARSYAPAKSKNYFAVAKDKKPLGDTYTRTPRGGGISKKQAHKAGEFGRTPYKKSPRWFGRNSLTQGESRGVDESERRRRKAEKKGSALYAKYGVRAKYRAGIGIDRAKQGKVIKGAWHLWRAGRAERKSQYKYEKWLRKRGYNVSEWT
jgi:hypothetical protein